jgi:hypothetical protein
MTDCPAGSGTYHLVVSNPPTQTEFLDMLTRHLGVCGVQVIEETALSNPSSLEARLARMLAPYRKYLTQSVLFDDAFARKRLDGSGILPPRIDTAEIARLVRLATGIRRDDRRLLSKLSNARAASAIEARCLLTSNSLAHTWACFTA